jgi:hypothetical protein
MNEGAKVFQQSKIVSLNILSIINEVLACYEIIQLASDIASTSI